MLANPDFKWKKQPQIKVWRKQSNDGESSAKLETYGPVESISLFKEALRNNEVKFQFLNSFFLLLFWRILSSWLHLKLLWWSSSSRVRKKKRLSFSRGYRICAFMPFFILIKFRKFLLFYFRWKFIRLNVKSRKKRKKKRIENLLMT